MNRHRSTATSRKVAADRSMRGGSPAVDADCWLTPAGTESNGIEEMKP